MRRIQILFAEATREEAENVAILSVKLITFHETRKQKLSNINNELRCKHRQQAQVEVRTSSYAEINKDAINRTFIPCLLCKRCWIFQRAFHHKSLIVATFNRES